MTETAVKDTLLTETLAVLKAYGLSPADVRWVGVLKNDKTSPVGSWDDFERLADFEYDSGYGGAEINSHLKIVGDDWWLERGEYDGSEWWEFKKYPSKPSDCAPLRDDDLKERW